MGAIERPSLFMDDPDVVRMTGFRRPSKQIEWLREHHYQFEINGLGKPAVFINQGKQAVNVTDDFQMKFAS
jgi:hypothetical protein